jgi:hypothetical protein
LRVRAFCRWWAWVDDLAFASFYQTISGYDESMTEPRRPNWLDIIGTVLLVLAAMSAAYIGGYYLIPDRTKGSLPLPDGTTRLLVVRYFRSAWIAYLYVPAANIEARITGEDVVCAFSVDGGAIKIAE